MLHKPIRSGVFMESKSMKSNLPLVRRCLAIGLVLLSIMFLFWPTVVSTSSRLRNSWIDERADRYVHEYDCSESQARTIASLNLANSLRGLSVLDLRNTLTYYALHQSVEDAYKKDTRGEDWFDNYLDTLRDDQKTERTLNTLGGVCVNVFFFCMLAAGVAAIVLYALNKTRIAGIVFAVLAVLVVAVAIGYMIYTNVSQNELLDAKNVSDKVWDLQHDPVAPGVSMFLIPIFAIASCIVYQRTGRKKTRAPKAKPASAPAAPYAPAPRAAAPAGNPFVDAPRIPRDPFAETAPSSGTPFAPAQPAPRDPFAETVRSDNPFAPTQPASRDPFAETVRPSDNPFTSSSRDPFAETMRSSDNPFASAQRTPFRAPAQPESNSFASAPRPAAPFENPFASAQRPAAAEKPETPSASAPRPAEQNWTCMQCGTPNPDSARFCTGCGTPKPSVKRAPVCGSCGRELKPGARFCPYCGERQA